MRLDRGIDNMRDIRQQVTYAPRWQEEVYIIDEVHMFVEGRGQRVSQDSRSPRLRRLHPRNDEFHNSCRRLSAACQRYDFRKVDFGAALARLSEVVAREGIR